MNTLSVQTNSRSDFVDMTLEIQQWIRTNGISDGIVNIFVPHTTAGITINENADPDVVTDIITVLDRMIPWTGGYLHMEGNTAAHVKASMMGSSVQVFVENGALCLGTWQSIYLCEFDGPRNRHLWIKAS